MKVLTGMISSLTLLSLNLVALSQVQAQTPGFELQEVPVTLFENGCSNRTAKGILNADTLSIILSEFEAKASSLRLYQNPAISGSVLMYLLD